jgi:ribosomal protein L13E
MRRQWFARRVAPPEAPVLQRSQRGLTLPPLAASGFDVDRSRRVGLSSGERREQRLDRMARCETQAAFDLAAA